MVPAIEIYGHMSLGKIIYLIETRSPIYIRKACYELIEKRSVIKEVNDFNLCVEHSIRMKEYKRWFSKPQINPIYPWFDHFLCWFECKASSIIISINMWPDFTWQRSGIIFCFIASIKIDVSDIFKKILRFCGYWFK